MFCIKNPYKYKNLFEIIFVLVAYIGLILNIEKYVLVLYNVLANQRSSTYGIETERI